MMPKKQYRVLIEQALFRALDRTQAQLLQEIIGQLEMEATGFLDLFVLDLYEYMCNEDKINYLSGPSPRYIATAQDICNRKPNDFRKAIRSSHFEEKKFKEVFYHCCIRDPSYPCGALTLYLIFGVISNDFIDLCECSVDSAGRFRLDELKLHDIKEAPDREIIDQLFQTLEFESYSRQFIVALAILKHLTEIGAISLLEVHRRLRLVNDMFNERHFTLRNQDDYIFDFLMDISCFNKNQESRESERFFTRLDILREFQKVVDASEKEINFFRRTIITRT